MFVGRILSENTQVMALRRNGNNTIWVLIPPGEVTLERGWDGWDYDAYGIGQTYHVPAFRMTKYPITNAQFALFMDAGGYSRQSWWTEAGWAKRESAGWTQPRYWHDSKWNHLDCPVVGVSWYEALAYCRWLGRDSHAEYTLPTEQQWQRTAQGDDQREYPWGEGFDAERCNNSVGRDWKLNSTTYVGRYGDLWDSPFGVSDLSGNVWEWCRTAYQTGSVDVDDTLAQVQRGGSWINDNPAYFRAAYRGWHNPKDWYGTMGGFRPVWLIDA